MHPRERSAGNSMASQVNTNAQMGADGAGGRYEEALRYKTELEEAKKENEQLRKRVRELEVMVRRGRSSRDTSASASERNV